MSTTRTVGSVRRSTRFSIFASRYFPSLAFRYDSSDGVALPSTTAHPSMCPLITATSRALYLGASSCLYAGSCSSSTTSSPSGLTGANSALRAPTTTRACPAAILLHSSCLSPSDKWLCSTATVSPNRPRKRSIVCGVSAISGTSAIAPFPVSSADWIAAK